VNEHCSVWAKRFGDPDDQYANAVAVDANNNVLVVGAAQETINFGGQDLNAGGSYSAFVVKLSKDGAHVWSRMYGDAQAQEATAVDVDFGGNVYVTGTFSGTISFDNGATTLTSGGAQDVFVVKLDQMGTPIWARAFSGAGTQNARGISVDGNGNVYVTGSFDGTTSFLGTMATSNSQLDGYLVRLNTNGVLSWVKTFGGTGNDEGTAVYARQTNVVVTGYFDTSADFGGGLLDAGGGVDTFVARYTTGGAFDLAKGYQANGDQHPRSVATDGNGNIYLFGDFTQEVSFGNGSTPSAGGTDVFAARLDNQGLLQWLETYGDAADQNAGGMAYESTVTHALAVHHRGTVDYGIGSMAAAGAPPNGDVVVGRFESFDGSSDWVRRFGDASDQDPRGVAFDGTKNVLVVGSLTGTTDFGSGPLTSAGGRDVFIAKLTP
jgi:hypothetical protein